MAACHTMSSSPMHRTVSARRSQDFGVSGGKQWRRVVNTSTRSSRLLVAAAWWPSLPSLGNKGGSNKGGKALGRKDMIDLGAVQVSPMGIGTWAWGNKLLWGYDQQMNGELQEAFNLCLDRGVNLFDTADSYGTGALNGQSEKLLGQFMQDYPGTPKNPPIIATKFAAYPWRITRASMVRAAKASANRLNQETIGIGQLHWSTANYQPLQERAMWAGLVQMYELGLVEAVGVSNYGPKQLKKIHKYLTENGVPLVTAQVQYSLLSQTAETAGIEEACKELGLQIIAYSPMALGILSKRNTLETIGGIKGPRAQLFKSIVPELDPLYGVLEAVAEERGKTMSQVAINWCIQKGTIPIPGVKSLEQAEQNLGSLGWKLGAGEVNELETIAARVPKQMVQNIFMTK